MGSVLSCEPHGIIGQMYEDQRMLLQSLDLCVAQKGSNSLTWKKGNSNEKDYSFQICFLFFQIPNPKCHLLPVCSDNDLLHL